MKKFEHYWWKILIVGFILIIIWKVIDIKWIINSVRSVIRILTPFIIGAVLAFFTVRPSKKLEELLLRKFKKMKGKSARSISIIFVYVAFIAVLALILQFMIPAIYRNLQELIMNMPEYYKVVGSYLGSLEVFENINVFDKLNETLSSFLNFDMMGKFVGIVSAVANSVISFFLSIVLSIYILIERDALSDVVKTIARFIIKRKKTAVVTKYFSRLIDIFYAYFTGLMIDAVIIGAAATIFFYFFDAPYPWLLGLVVVIGNMIPFFGPIVSAALTYVVCVIAMGPLHSLWALAFMIIIGQIDGNFIQPKIVGTSVGVSPFWVIFSVMLFGGILGPVGMIVGTPITAAVRMLYIDHKKNRGSFEDAVNGS